MLGAAKPSGLTLVAIAAVFTIGYAARMLGEDEDCLHDLSINMFPEDGCLHVYGVGDDGVTAFTEYGIECLRQIAADELYGRKRTTNKQFNRIAPDAAFTECLRRIALHHASPASATGYRNDRTHRQGNVRTFAIPDGVQPVRGVGSEQPELSLFKNQKTFGFPGRYDRTQAHMSFRNVIN